MCLVSAKQGASCLLLICLANRTRSSMMPSSRVGFPTPVATTSMPRMKLFQHRHAANIRPGARIHRACGGGGRLRSSSTVRRTSVSWCRWTTPSAATVCRPSHSPNSFLPVLKGSGRTPPAARAPVDPQVSCSLRVTVRRHSRASPMVLP
jgi:hypothetical protein